MHETSQHTKPSAWWWLIEVMRLPREAYAFTLEMQKMSEGHQWILTSTNSGTATLHDLEQIVAEYLEGVTFNFTNPNVSPKPLTAESQLSSDVLPDTQVPTPTFASKRGLMFPAFLGGNKPMGWCSQQLARKTNNKAEFLAQNNHNKPRLAFFTHEVVGRGMYLHFLCHKSKAR